MSDLAPAASPSVFAAAGARRGESRCWVVARTAFPFLVVALAWEVTAHLGIFPRRLFRPLEDVAAALVRLTGDGVLPHHVLDTLLRLLAGFALAAVAGVAIGFAMGRSRRAEDVFLPLVSIGAPIPGLAYAPLFLLSFGLCNTTAVLLVGFVSAFPVVFNTWTGVKPVKDICVRPTLPMVRSTLSAVILPGRILEPAGYSMYCVLVGLALAVARALPLGILMGRFRPVENFFLPLASALMLIPSLAWVPVFILWFW